MWIRNNNDYVTIKDLNMTTLIDDWRFTLNEKFKMSLLSLDTIDLNDLKKKIDEANKVISEKDIKNLSSVIITHNRIITDINEYVKKIEVKKKELETKLNRIMGE